jgi:hypothetical protein
MKSKGMKFDVEFAITKKTLPMFVRQTKKVMGDWNLHLVDQLPCNAMQNDFDTAEERRDSAQLKMYLLK